VWTNLAPALIKEEFLEESLHLRGRPVALEQIMAGEQGGPNESMGSPSGSACLTHALPPIYLFCGKKRFLFFGKIDMI